jgi:hypothetical protein
MDQDAGDLYERLRITLDRADRGKVRIADEIEYVLTEGYAFALGLEMRRRRIDKRIAELVKEPSDVEVRRRLVNDRTAVDEELEALRGTLARLEAHCEELVAAGRVAMPARDDLAPEEALAELPVERAETA